MKTSALDSIDIKNWYISKFDFFESKLNGNTTIPFHKIRKDAISKFSQLHFPTTKNEEWKYTSVATLLKHKFELTKVLASLPEAALDPFMFKGLDTNLLVFVNGQYSRNLSKIEPCADNLVIDSFANALLEHTDLVQKHLAKHAGYDKDIFTALNTAFATEGAFIHIPKNVVLEKPIYILHLSDFEKSEILTHPRNLFIAEEGSQVKIIEGKHALADATYFSNTITEIVVEANANIEHYKVQNESRKSFHIETRQVSMSSDATYSSVSIDLGGELVRNNLNIALNGQNCEAHFHGFYFGRENQLIDNHTLIDHAQPHCNSNELYKGILDDHSKGVFNGKVMVRKDAQKTNAFQENKTILLTDTATINSKPQLEIFADDVKCSHGATIGQLDEEALFYLRSRGIPQQEAQSMLRYAFASDVFNYISIDAVKQQVQKLVLDCFGKTE